MSVKIMVNGQEILKDTESTSYAHLRDALATLMTTANIDAKGSQNAAAKLVQTAEKWAKKPETDVITVFEKPETKNAVEKKTAEYTVRNVANRIKDALNMAQRSGTIFKDETTETTGNKSLAESADY